QSEGAALRVRRSQFAYLTPEGNSSLSVLTATTAVEDWDNVEFEIRSMEDSWIATTATPDDLT
ncbi:MAG: acetyltransferase, partial [Actinomycetota bacterium]|nr:acetyltransferase [Actinomycetota bacterium]